MQKLIPLLCALAVFFCGCAHSEKPPVISTDTSFDAVYTTGDFSFNCTIRWQKNTVYVTVNSTNAAGLTISCDGSRVVFTRGTMIKTQQRQNIDNTNPAVLLWEIFTALESGGNHCSLGTFTVEQNSGSISKIAVSDITVVRAEND